MLMGGDAAAEPASPAVHPGAAGSPARSLASQPSCCAWTCPAPIQVSSTAQFIPRDAGRLCSTTDNCDSQGGAEDLDEELEEKRALQERAVRQVEIFVEEEPALVHTRHVHHGSYLGQDQLGAAYAWSPATPELAELIPIGTSQSPRESYVTHDTGATPCSPYESRNASPRTVTLSAATRVGTAFGGSTQNALAPRVTLSHSCSSPCVHSPTSDTVVDATPASSRLSQREAHDDEKRNEADALRGSAAASPDKSTRLPSSPNGFRRCPTAAPTCLHASSDFKPERGSSPQGTRAATPVLQEKSASVSVTPDKSSFVNLRVVVDSPSLSSAPLCINSVRTSRTNASGGAIPDVPAIHLPVTQVPSGMESDRSVSVMGYGPRSAPNACSLVSARSGRSSRSARHSHRCYTAARAALPSLKELFPTLPAEMYLARDRLCVSHDNTGRLGVGAYGTVQRAELYPPEVEVPRFFTPVAETGTSMSIPNTPRYSPANCLLSSHNFSSIAGEVGGADSAGATATSATAAAAQNNERGSGVVHSRMASMWSTDSVSTLPLHQQPYNDHTASFYNGLDDLPYLTRAESLSDPHFSVRGQTPDVEPVIVCGPLTMDTESEEVSAPATVNTKTEKKGGASPASPPLQVPKQRQQELPHHLRAHREDDNDGGETTPYTSATSCSASQKFPDLPAVLAMKLRSGDLGGFSLTSPQISVARLTGDDLFSLEADDNCVRLSVSGEDRRSTQTGPLKDSALSIDAELSQTSTTGTRQFTSPNSPRCDTRVQAQSCHTTDNSNDQRGGAREGDDDVDDSDGQVNNSTTLPTQMLFDGEDGAAAPVVVVGDEVDGLLRLAARRTTKVHPTEMPLPPVSESSPLAYACGSGVDGVAASGAAMRLPLVLSRVACTTTSSTSGRATASSRDGSEQRFGLDATPEAEDGDKADVSIEHSSEAGPPHEADDNGDSSVSRDRRVSSLGTADNQEMSFLASVNIPEMQMSLARVGDDTLTCTAQQAIARAVREAREEMEDASAHLDDAEQRQAQMSGRKTAHADDYGGEGQKDSGRNGDATDANNAAAAAASYTMPKAVHPPFTCGSTTLMSGQLPTSSSALETKRTDVLSPTSTISSLFSGGVTAITTTQTSKQGSVGVGAQASAANPLQSPLTNAAPLMRFGVNSLMISEAVSNGCAPFRPVATKVVEKADLADNAMKLNAFHNELRMASRLNHPCLVNMFGVTEDADNFYLVMDMAEKGNLTQYQREFGVRDTRVMAPRFLADVVLALEYLQDGSQHTYWMTAQQAERGAGTLTNEVSASTAKPPATEQKDAESFPGSSSTQSLRLPTADVSALTTPKPSLLLSGSGTSLQRHAEDGERTATGATAGEKAAADSTEVRLYNADTPAEPAAQLMTESIVLHRDMKPDNLLLTWDFHVKLADFGDACFYGDEEANSFGGTPSYISPEVIRCSKASPCSDLWAMGCILYELLVGEKLFTGSLREVANSIQAFCADELVFPDTTTAAVDGDDDGDTDEPEASKTVSGESSSGGISDAAKDLVRQLLRRVPEERLGSAERGGFAALKQHPFFAEIDWATVLETTNMTTTNTDYASELADYVEPGESVVYCSPVKVLPTNEAHTRTCSVHLASLASLVMVLTDAPRLFLVNPDTDTVQFAIPWSSELRVGVLHADRFTITVPISDVLISPSTPGTAFNAPAPASTTSRASTSTTCTTTTTITYTFYDTTRRADLWGVKIHHIQATCPARHEGGTPTFPSRQSSMQAGSSTSGVPPLHWPPLQNGQRRGTPTLSPRVGSCLLHRLRTTPRSGRAGSISTHAISFSETSIATPREGRSAGVSVSATAAGGSSGGGGSSVEHHTAASAHPSAAPSQTAAAAVVSASKLKSTARYGQPAHPPATSFLAASAPSAAPLTPTAGKAALCLTSDTNVPSTLSSCGAAEPPQQQRETAQTRSPATAAPVHRRANTMTVTIASSSSSSSHQRPTLRGRPCPLHSTATAEGCSNSGASPVDFGTTMTDTTAHAAAAASSTATATTTAATTPLAESVGGHSGGGSLSEDALGLSGSAGQNTPRLARVGDNDDAARATARDTRSQSEATPGPSSGQRHIDCEAELGGSFPSQGSLRSDGEVGRTIFDTPVKAAASVGSGGSGAGAGKAPPKETISKARQQYKKTQRKKTQV